MLNLAALFRAVLYCIFFRAEVGAYAADNRATVSDVVAQASNEQQLMTSVANIKSVWGKFEFKLLPYREYKDIFYLTEIDEVMQQLEENQVSFVGVARHV